MFEVSLRVGLASSYDHGDMLMKMVKEADQQRVQSLSCGVHVVKCEVKFSSLGSMQLNRKTTEKMSKGSVMIE